MKTELRMSLFFLFLVVLSVACSKRTQLSDCINLTENTIRNVEFRESQCRIAGSKACFEQTVELNNKEIQRLQESGCQ